MPTISDLNAAFAELEHQSPIDITSLVGPTHQATIHRLPRRSGAVLAGVVGVAACVAAAVVVSSGALSGTSTRPAAATAPAASSAAHKAHGSTPATTEAPDGESRAITPVDAIPLPLTDYVYTLGKLPAGMTLYTTYNTAVSQQLAFKGKSDVTAWVSASGVWHPSIPADAISVKVDGHDGYYATKFDLSGAAAINNPLYNGASAPGVLWQAGAGRWGFVTQLALDTQKRVELSNAEYVAIASAIHVGQNQPFTTPVKFGYVPKNLKLSSTSFIGAPGSDVRYEFQPTVLTGYVLDVELSQGRFPMGTVGTQTLHINGWSGPYGANEGSAVYTKNGVSVTLMKNDGDEGPGKGFPLADITKILNNLQVAPAPATASSWFLLANALTAATR